MTHSSMTTVVKYCVAYIEMPHELGKIRRGGLYDQMKVLCKAPRYVELSASHF